MRLGGIDFAALLREEWQRYDVPRFMCIEGAKLRYLMTTHVTRALHEGMFDLVSGPTARTPLPALNRHLFKFPAFLPLWEGVPDDILLDFVMQPARQDRLQQLAVGSGLHILKLQRLPDNIRLFVSGGLLASDRVLSGLGARAEGVFLKAWQIPPLFSTPPASRSGMHIKVFAGLALSTAVDWCRPHLHQLRAVAQKRRQWQEQRRLEEDNVVDHELLQPTAQQVEKRRLFSLFSKGKASAAAETKTVGPATAAPGGDLDAAFPLQYPESDDESDIRDGNDGATTATSGATDSQHTVDLDTGVVRTMGEVELEVVVRINYESSAILDQVGESVSAVTQPILPERTFHAFYDLVMVQVRTAFAHEVGNSCRYMQECQDWKLHRVLAHRDGEKTADFGTKSEVKTSIFLASDLGHPSANSAWWGSMEDMVGKCGTAVVEASMLFPDADSRLTKQQMLNVFSKIIHRTAAADGQRGEAGAGSGNSAFYSADFRDLAANKDAAQRPTSGVATPSRDVPTPSSRATPSRGADTSATTKHIIRKCIVVDLVAIANAPYFAPSCLLRADVNRRG